MRLGRRSFLTRTAALAGAGALPFVFLARRARAAGYGPLVSDPDGILDLPSGFSYAIVEESGATMSDGYRVPAKPDGMACFPAQDGSLVLLRNHEVSGSSSEGPYGGGQSAPPEAYDPSSYGGVTRVVVDAVSYGRVSSNLVLAGTAQNCAGGPSPWGWLSCEETFDAEHGYVFVCPVDASSVVPPQRVVGYGHFRHEAVAIETPSNRAYLTEDRSDSCLYRFVPDAPASPFVGRLQALGVVGQPGFETADGLDVGDELSVTWIDLADPDPASDTLRATAVAAGAAVIRRGEGIWYHDGVVYFDSTNGGPSDLGQIFALRPTADGGSLTLVAQSTNEAMLNGPDNMVMAPWGDLIVAEDSVNGSGVHHLRGLTPAGEMYELARTTRSELAGVCFSPDGRALFVNVYGDGLTLVITGPFPEIDAGGSGGEGGQGGEPGSSGEGGASNSPEPTAGADTGGSGEGGLPASPSGGTGGAGGSSATAAGGSGRGGAGAGTGGGAFGSSGMPASAGTNTSGSAGGGGRAGSSAGSSGASAGTAGPITNQPATDTSDGCACHVGPGARAGNDDQLTALTAVAAAVVALRARDEKPD